MTDSHCMDVIIKKLRCFLPGLIEASFLVSLAFLPVSKAIGEIGIITGLCAWIVKKVIDREKLFCHSWMTVSYLLFLAVTALSLLQIPHETMATGIRGLFKYLKFLGLFLAAGETFNTPAKRIRLCTVFIISMTVISLNGFYQLAAGTDMLRHYALEPGRIARMRSSMASPNHLAAFLLFAAPLAFFAAGTHPGKRQKSLYLLLACVFLIALISTFSRAALFGFSIAVLLYLLRCRKFTALGIVLLLSGILLLPIDVIRNNFFGTLTLTDTTIKERLHFWQVTWAMIQAHPWLGIGINMYTKKYMLFAPAGITLQAYTHNSYLQLCAEIGIPGMLCFLAPLAKVFRPSDNLTRGEPSDCFYPAVQISLTAFLIQSLADNNFFALQTAALFWLFWGVYAGSYLAKAKTRANAAAT